MFFVSEFKLENVLGFSLYTGLRKILNQISSPLVNLEKLDDFQEEIKQFLILFKQTFPGILMTYKMHYLLHYPEAMRRFGPLWRMCTLRFERKHQLSKRQLRTSHNRKAVSKSVMDWARNEYYSTFLHYENMGEQPFDKFTYANDEETNQVAELFGTNANEIEVIKPKEFEYKGLIFAPGNLFIKRNHDIETGAAERTIHSWSETILFMVKSVFLARIKTAPESTRKLVIVTNKIRKWKFERTTMLIKVDKNFERTEHLFSNELNGWATVSLQANKSIGRATAML